MEKQLKDRLVEIAQTVKESCLYAGNKPRAEVQFAIELTLGVMNYSLTPKELFEIYEAVDVA